MHTTYHNNLMVYHSASLLYYDSMIHGNPYCNPWSLLHSCFMLRHTGLFILATRDSLHDQFLETESKSCWQNQSTKVTSIISFFRHSYVSQRHPTATHWENSNDCVRSYAYRRNNENSLPNHRSPSAEVALPRAVSSQQQQQPSINPSSNNAAQQQSLVFLDNPQQHLFTMKFSSLVLLASVGAAGAFTPSLPSNKVRSERRCWKTHECIQISDPCL